MATIYLIRHGQASFGAENYDKLSPLGCLQATATGEYLARANIEFDAVYSGTLSRQRKTCELAIAKQAGNVMHHIDSRFNEINNDEQVEHLAPVIAQREPQIAAILGRGLGNSRDYQKVIEAVFNYWVSGQCEEPLIQSWDEYSTAVMSALRDVIETQGGGKTVGIFTSGGTIATIVAQVLGLTGNDTYKFYEPIFNCSISQLFYNKDKVSLSYFNERSFLQMMGVEQGTDLVSYR